MNRSKPWRVTCYSLVAFRRLEPVKTTAVISIGDEMQMVPLAGWGPSHACLFTDVEYDEKYVRSWGWRVASEAGLFTPAQARRMLEFLRSEEVKRCEEIVVHCHAGESRSTAVGTYISEAMGAELKLTSARYRPNKTVLDLLRNPDCMGKESSGEKDETGGKRMLSRVLSLFG